MTSEHTQQEERSDVEYIFESMEEPERSIFEGIEQQPQRHYKMRAVISSRVYDTRAVDVTDVPAQWAIVQLTQLIAETFSELFTAGQIAAAERAARQWQFNILHHSDLHDADLETALSHLQGIIETIERSRKEPTRWWPGKQARLNDPRREAPGSWYKAQDVMGRHFKIRKVSALGVEVSMNGKEGTTLMCIDDAKSLYTVGEKLAA